MAEKIIVYGTPVCPGMPAVHNMLKQANADYDYINIHDDGAARQRVREINNGFESVPTIVFPDGNILTEPSGNALSRALIERGYEVPLLARIVSYWPQALMISAVIFAILRGTNIL